MLAVVLDDEETFTGLEGCQVVEVADDYLDDNDSYNGDGRVIAEFTSEAPYVELDGAEPEDDTVFVVVLADGETFSAMDGVTVVELDDDYAGDEPVSDGVTLAEF